MFRLHRSLALLLIASGVVLSNQASAGGPCHARSSYQRYARVVPSRVVSHAPRYYSSYRSQPRYSYAQPQRSQRVRRARANNSAYAGGGLWDGNFNGSVDAFEPNYGGAVGLSW